jgi:hypothetical protein
MNWRNTRKQVYNFFKWLVWDFSCLHFIWTKILPSTSKSECRRSPSTFLIWAVGIYIACYGVASQKYENRLDMIENRTNTIFTQLASPAFKSALSRIPIVQQMSCPQTPKLLYPPSVFHSLIGSGQEYAEIVGLLKETVENWKESLEDVDLSLANLEGAQLDSANLREATLVGTNLRNANLENADLRYANLQDADLQNANLENADLRYAIIIGADLERAYLRNSNLISINAPPPQVRKKHELARIRANKKKYGKYLPPSDYLPGDLVDQLLRVGNLYKAKIETDTHKKLFRLRPKLFENSLPESPNSIIIRE